MELQTGAASSGNGEIGLNSGYYNYLARKKNLLKGNIAIHLIYLPVCMLVTPHTAEQRSELYLLRNDASSSLDNITKVQI